MSSSAARNNQLHYNTAVVMSFCRQYKLDVSPLNNGYQLRIENVLDIYPVNGRWHWLPTGERGGWNNLKELRQIMLDRLTEIVVPQVDTHRLEILTGNKTEEKISLWQRIKNQLRGR